MLLVTAALAAAVALVATATDASASVPTQAKLTSTLLTQSDLPSGWTAQPVQGATSATTGAIPTSMAHCLGLAASAVKTTAFAVSTFTRTPDSIGSTAASYSSATALRKDLAAIRSKTYGKCYESSVESEFTGGGATIKKATVSQRNGYRGAPHGVICVVDLSITASIRGTTTVSDNLSQVIISGYHTIEDVVGGTGTSTAFPAALLHSASTAVAKRVARL